MRDSGELAGAWRVVSAPPVTTGRSRAADENALHGIAVGCLLSLPLWVAIGALLHVALD